MIKCLKMYKISDKIIRFITKTMKNWEVELAAGGQTLTHLPLQFVIVIVGDLSR